MAVIGRVNVHGGMTLGIKLTDCHSLDNSCHRSPPVRGLSIVLSSEDSKHGKTMFPYAGRISRSPSYLTGLHYYVDWEELD